MPSGRNTHSVTNRSLIAPDGFVSLGGFIVQSPILHSNTYHWFDEYRTQTAIDPTNPSVRSGLGLSYLLLGVTATASSDDAADGDKFDAENDSVQLVFQSIQHLKAAMGLTTARGTAADEDHGVDEDGIAAVRTAATHNLGLAYLALDGMGAGSKTTHFLEWTSSPSYSLMASMESLSGSANEGASLLQSGRFEEAASRLEAASGEVCGEATHRQGEVCRIIRQNLDVARQALSGEQVEAAESSFNSAGQFAGSGVTIHDEVARWNAASSISDMEPSDDIEADDVATSPSEEEEDDADTADGSDEGKGDASLSSANEGMDGSSAAADPTETEPKAEPNGNAQEMEGAIDPPPPAPVTPMQSALAALEKAATREGPRTRLLLALARARVSAGDVSGAVDAALEAIGAATSMEESDGATTYLESLMDKMASSDAGAEEVEETASAVSEEQQPPTASEELRQEEKTLATTSFVESRDFVLSELQLKLELERLKYKVLEQEMMLGRYRQQHHQRDPRAGYDDNRDVEMRAIDYPQEDDDGILRRDTPRRRDTGADVRESIVVTTKVPVDHEMTTAEDAEVEYVAVEEEGTTFAEDVTEESSALDVPTNETDDDAADSGAGNETTLSETPREDTELEASVAVDGENVELNENRTSTAEIEVAAAADLEEEVAVAAEPEEEVLPIDQSIELPSLYDPARKPPGPIP